MKNKDIRSKGEEELTGKMEEMRLELIKLNAQVATGTTPKKPGQIKQLKKTIARIKTTLNEKGRVSK
ncbi:50S ribosomal protein L29 [Candidatus Woesearchaeota archaeon]|jgi:large subunit ribosomal protein L29|nr:50S ribosomal protein L29 [Candidatus Woesearchaeota archaeon]MBT3537442.1 50S ribosomal protein L29 [Candidatus Woesearchaeota archaeon]MBT4697757.1 50S ribosomal protein L29 [Candidatus Woesearchaeota archaeon]MBT4717556.1 50S ribosomal protein L29 [Candidatus Woesearchaeota archaeon]MBT7106248.1 50S ribosomal protein L29 [Candidatus Woesearchaeota archaeon]